MNIACVDEVFPVIRLFDLYEKMMKFNVCIDKSDLEKHNLSVIIERNIYHHICNGGLRFEFSFFIGLYNCRKTHALFKPF